MMVVNPSPTVSAEQARPVASRVAVAPARIRKLPLPSVIRKLRGSGRLLHLLGRLSPADRLWYAPVPGAADLRMAASPRLVPSPLYWSPKAGGGVASAIQGVLGRYDRPIFGDVGAHFGATVMQAKLAGAGAIVALEPLEVLAEAVAATARLNDWVDVQVWQAAAADQAGWGRLFAAPGALDLGTTIEDFRPGHRAGQYGHRVVLTTLDELWPRTGLASPDLVKIDVEGAELAVIQGARELLADTRPDLVIEILPSRHDEARRTRAHAVWTLLMEFGYEAWRLPAEGPWQPIEQLETNVPLADCNYLFTARPGTRAVADKMAGEAR